MKALMLSLLAGLMLMTSGAGIYSASFGDAPECCQQKHACCPKEPCCPSGEHTQCSILRRG